MGINMSALESMSAYQQDNIDYRSISRKVSIMTGICSIMKVPSLFWFRYGRDALIQLSIRPNQMTVSPFFGICKHLGITTFSLRPVCRLLTSLSTSEICQT